MVLTWGKMGEPIPAQHPRNNTGHRQHSASLVASLVLFAIVGALASLAKNYCVPRFLS